MLLNIPNKVQSMSQSQSKKKKGWWNSQWLIQVLGCLVNNLHACLSLLLKSKAIGNLTKRELAWVWLSVEISPLLFKAILLWNQKKEMGLHLLSRCLSLKKMMMSKIRSIK